MPRRRRPRLESLQTLLVFGIVLWSGLETGGSSGYQSNGCSAFVRPSHAPPPSSSSSSSSPLPPPRIRGLDNPLSSTITWATPSDRPRGPGRPQGQQQQQQHNNNTRNQQYNPNRAPTMPTHRSNNNNNGGNKRAPGPQIRGGGGGGGGGRSGQQSRVVKILSGKEYTAEDILAVVDDSEVSDFLKLYRSEGLVKALFKLGALLLRDSQEKKVAVHKDPRFHRLLAQLEVQAMAPAGFSAQSYSKILTALAHLDYVPPRHFLDHLRDGMLLRLHQQVAAGPQQPPTPPLLAGVSLPGGPSLRGGHIGGGGGGGGGHNHDPFFDPYSLSHIISAFVNLDCYRPGPEFMTQYTEVVANNLMEFQPVGLMSIIRGFAKLGHDPGTPFLKVFTACAKRKLHEFPPRALSSTIQGLATLRHQPPPDFMAQLVLAMDNQLDNFSWLDIPNAITALSKLLYLPPEPFLRRIVAKAREKLPAFNPQALCNFIFGLFKLQHDPGVDFMAAYFQACRAKMSKFTPAGFSSMIHSVARLGYYPGPEFMRDFEAHVTPQLQHFSRGELWKLAHGLATLYHRPTDSFLGAYWASFALKGTKLTVKDISLVLWSFSVLDIGNGHANALLALVDTATDLVGRYQLDPQDDEFAFRPGGGDDPAVLKYRQLVQGSMYLQTLRNPSLDRAVKRLDGVLQEAWRRRGVALAAAAAAAAGDGGEGVVVSGTGSVEKEGGKDKRRKGGRVSASAGASTSSSPLPLSLAMTQPTFHASVMETASTLGLRVSSGTLNEVFNLELLLYPWQASSNSNSNAPRGEAALPVVVLLEGRGHFFTNALGRFTGDAEFRRFLVNYHAEYLRKFRAVAQVTIWDWRNAKTQGSKLRVLRNVLRKHGLDPSVYIPPTTALKGVMEEEEEEEEEEEHGGMNGSEEQVVVMGGGGPTPAQGGGGGGYKDETAMTAAVAVFPPSHASQKGVAGLSSRSAVAPSASNHNRGNISSVCTNR